MWLGFDTAGNMANDGNGALLYDAENRLLSATNGAALGSYTYDGNNLRVSKSSGATTVYLFSGSKVIAEYASGAAPASPSREYIYAGSQLLATLTGPPASATAVYHIADHLSPRVTTDSSGTLIGQQAHYPFGEDWYASSSTTKFKFTSYERDSESGNDYAMLRTSVNRLGRFSSPDPLAGSLADPQSLNRYTYTRNDPGNLVDPLGLRQICLAIHTTVIRTYTGWLYSGDSASYAKILTVEDLGSDLICAGGDESGRGGGSLTKEFREKLKAALNNLADRCKKVLPLSDLKKGVSRLNFFAASSSASPEANLRGSDVSPGASPKPLFQQAKGVGAFVLPKTSAAGKLQPSNNIVIGSLWNGLGDWQGVTLVHEEMHSFTGKNDAGLWDFAKQNGAVQDPNNSDPSWNFSNWLKAGCPDERKK